jgi:hypothetical protein
MRKAMVVGLGLLAGLVGAGQVFAVGQVSGKYVGNGKVAKLAHAVVVSHDPWKGELAYTLVLSEKDPSSSKDAGSDALFGKLGDALTITVTKSGSIIGTQVCHQALKRAGFSSLGVMSVEGLKIEGGNLSGRFYTQKLQDFFDDTWEVDVTAKAALPAGK